jgi:hypothetical protein
VVTVHTVDCFDRATPARLGDALRRAAVRTAVRAADEVIAVHPAMPDALAQAVRFDAAYWVIQRRI